MGIRTLASAALVAATTLALAACGGGSGSQDAGHDSGTGGCIGFGCGTGGGDAGTDGGTDGGNNNTDGGGGMDGGGGNDAGIVCYDGGVITTTLRDLRDNSDVCTLPFGAQVIVNDVVVHTVSYSKMGTNNAWRADFWVSDPNDPPYGIWISKFYNDPPMDYLPKAGDAISVQGYFGTISKYTNPTGYRREIAEKKVGTTFLPITITVLDAGTPPTPDVVTPGQFGDSDGGNTRPNPEHAGSRVYIQGPIEITNTSPTALHRVSANPNDTTYYGFEVTGGILINNSTTFKSDGGCPWRDIALDAGTQGQKVVFDGIYGVYDSWTFAACQDGGTDIFNCLANPGQVPGTNNDYTYIVYPQNCGDFVNGQVQ